MVLHSGIETLICEECEFCELCDRKVDECDCEEETFEDYTSDNR